MPSGAWLMAREEEEEEEEEEEGLFKGGGGRGGGGRFIQSPRSERGGPRARPRYPGVEDLFRRARRRRRRRKVFKADAVNEEDPEHDRATQV